MAQGVAPRSYQYRTLDFAYFFKTKERHTLILKVENIAGERLHRTSLSLNELQIPKVDFIDLTDEMVLKILAFLVSKRALPAELFPADFQPVAKPAEGGAASTQAPPPLPSSPAEPLDPATLMQLRAILMQSETLFKAAELADAKALQVVAQNPRAVEGLIASQNYEEQALGELSLLQQQKPEIYRGYYLQVYQKMVGICLASYTIKSGMVENRNENISGRLNQGCDYVGKFLDYAGKALHKTGEVVPAVGNGLKIIGALLQLKNVRDNHHAIAHLTLFFADLEESQKKLKTIARLLTREREAELCDLKPQKGIQKAYRAIKEWFTAEELTNPLVIQAGGDCERLLVGILDKTLTPAITPEEAVYYVLQRPLSKKAPSIRPMPSAAAAAAAAVFDPASKVEVERLQKELEALKAKSVVDETRQNSLQRRLREAEKTAALARAYTEAAFGPLVDVGEQLKFQEQDDADPSKALSPGQALLRVINTNVQALQARIDEQGVEIAAAQEQVFQVAQRQQAPKSKKT